MQHAGALRLLGTLYAQDGDLTPARDTLRVALEATRKHWPPAHNTVTGAESRYASVLADLGEFDEAYEVATRALASLHPGSMPNPTAMAATARARALIARGRADEAAALVEETLAKFSEAGVEGRPVEMVEALRAR